MIVEAEASLVPDHGWLEDLRSNLCHGSPVAAVGRLNLSGFFSASQLRLRSSRHADEPAHTPRESALGSLRPSSGFPGSPLDPAPPAHLQNLCRPISSVARNGLPASFVSGRLPARR